MPSCNVQLGLTNAQGAYPAGSGIQRTPGLDRSLGRQGRDSPFPVGYHIDMEEGAVGDDPQLLDPAGLNQGS